MKSHYKVRPLSDWLAPGLADLVWTVRQRLRLQLKRARNWVRHTRIGIPASPRFAFRAGGVELRLCLGETASQGLLEVDGSFAATSNDPWVSLETLRPVSPGWCQIVLRGEGLRNPRVYLDFGNGWTEHWSLALDRRAGDGTHWSVAWLPAKVFGVRLDPSDGPGIFRLVSLTIDALPTDRLPQLLLMDEPAMKLHSGRSSPSRAMDSQALHPLSESQPQVLVLSEHSHLSGVSIRRGAFDRGVVLLELFALSPNGLEAVRSSVADLVGVDGEEWEHVYWEPVADSRQRRFLLRCTPSEKQALPERAVVQVRPIHSRPEPWSEVPHALVVSPVTACNLNCVHCISRPTRKRLERMTAEMWNDIKEVVAHRDFMRIATDYSGDILYDEARHGGWLSRLISLDVPFRIDTNATHLDPPVCDLLLGSKLSEINFSLDTMDPEAYRRVRRGSLPLPVILEKIAAFMRLKRASGHPAKALMSFALMRSTARTIKPALGFARDHGIDYVNVVPMIAFTPDMVDEVFVWDHEAYAALHHELSSEASRLGVNLTMQPPVRQWIDRDIHAPCDIPWGSAVVLGNGDVQACCLPGTRIGNLKEKSLRDIWNGAEFRKFRIRVNSPDPPLPCRNCSQNRVANNRRAYATAAHAHGGETKGAVTPIQPPKSSRGSQSEKAGT